jgi:mannosylglycerate hydrolase
MAWNDNNGIFKLINSDEDLYKLDYQYAHPFFEYHKEHIKQRGEQALKEQDNDWTTSHRFWSDGHDSSCPDIREIKMIQDLNEALPDANVFHSTLRDFEQSVISELDPNSPVLYGEMRAPFTKGSVSGMMGWIVSARTYIKQDNFNTEKHLTYLAEPLDVYATLLGAPSQQSFLTLAYNYLLQNQGHDSIGACGRDIVYEDVVSRYRQARELALCVFERAFMDMAGDIDLRGWNRDDMALVVYNPAPFARTETVRVRIEIPREWNTGTFQILDTDGSPLKFQVLNVDRNNAQVIQNPNDVANVLHTLQFEIQLEAKDIPGMGYKALKVQPLKNVRAQTPVTMLVAPQVMENEYLRVSFNANGTFDALDKETGRQYRSLGFFKDTAEIGNPWEHQVPDRNETFTTLNENAKITLLHDGELETAFKVVINWALPESRASDEKSRSAHLKPFVIENIVSLKKGNRWVEIETTVDNQVEDHYFQVGFPTQIEAEYSCAQGQFDVLKRPIAKLDYSLYDEIPMTEHPMNSFVDVSDGQYGAAFLNTGLKAYEASDDACRTVYLTLLRCFPLRICVTSDMQDYSQWEKGSQCIGMNKFRYAFMPHKGDWEQGKVWQASERFNLNLNVGQLAPTAHGKNGLTHAFLELETENLHVSAVKRAEEGNGYIVRLFNPSDTPVKNALRLNGGTAPIAKAPSPLERQAAAFELPKYSGTPWNNAPLVSLEEKEISPLTVRQDGFAEFEITGKKILTIQFN